MSDSTNWFVDILFFIATILFLVSISTKVDEVKHDLKAHSTTTTVSTTTTIPETDTTYKGIKCMVNGYEIHTGVDSAKAAGCK